jgi:hypothetical protein
LVAKGADPKIKNKAGQDVVLKTECADSKLYKYWKAIGLSLGEMSQGRSAISNCIALDFPKGLQGLKYLLSQGVPLPNDWENFPERRYVQEIKKATQGKKNTDSQIWNPHFYKEFLRLHWKSASTNRSRDRRARVLKEIFLGCSNTCHR